MSRYPARPTVYYHGKTGVYQFTYHTQEDVENDVPVSEYEETRTTISKDKQIYGAVRGLNKFDTFVIQPCVFWDASSPSSNIVAGSGLGAFIGGVYVGGLEDDPGYSWSGLSAGLNYLYVVATEENQDAAGDFKSSRLRRSVATVSNTTGDAPSDAIHVATYFSGVGGVYISTAPEEANILDNITLLPEHIADTEDPHGATWYQTALVVSGVTVRENAVVHGSQFTQGNTQVTGALSATSLTTTTLTTPSMSVATPLTLGTVTTTTANLYGATQVTAPIAADAGVTVDGRDISNDGANLDAHIANVSNPHTVTAAQLSALPTTGGTLTGNVLMSSGTAIDNVDIDANLKPLVQHGNADAYHGHAKYAFNTVYQAIAPAYKGGVGTITPAAEYGADITTSTLYQNQVAYYGVSSATSLRSTWILNDYCSGSCLDNYDNNHLSISASGVNYSDGPMTKFPTSPHFVNAGQYLWCTADGNQLQGASAFTVSTWVKFGALPASGSSCAICACWPASTNQLSWMLYLNNTGGTYQLRGIVSNDGSSSIGPAAYTWTPTLGVWYHIVFQASGSNIQLKVNNGSWQGTTAFSTTTYNCTYPFVIGTSNVNKDGTLYSTANRASNFAVMGVCLWSRALSDGEITTLYTDGFAREYSQLLSSTEYKEIGTSLVPSTTGSLTNVAFLGRKVGSPTGNTVCNVYTVAGGTPSTLVGTSDAVVTASWSTADSYVNFPFSSAPTLASGTEVLFTVSGLGAGIGTNYYEVRRQYIGCASGTAWYRTNTEWHQEPLPNRDLVFITTQTSITDISYHSYEYYSLTSGSAGPVKTITVYPPSGVTKVDSIQFTNKNTGVTEYTNLTFTDSVGTVFAPASGQGIYNNTWATTTVSGLGAAVLTEGLPCKIHLTSAAPGVDMAYWWGDLKVTYKR